MRRTRFNVILATTLFAMSLPVLSMDEVTIKPAVQPPVIDGVLDDPCWREATVIETLYNLEQPGQTSGEHQIMVTFDDQWLYAAYCVHQPEAQRQAPAHLKHDDFVQRDDCVKLSFDPGTDGAVYYHFKLNRANARREQKVTRTKGQTNGRQDIDNWNIPWRSAVRDNPEGWTAELAVPLALLTPTGKLSKAAINLLVTRYVVVTRDVAVNIATTERESLSAARLDQSFDEPEHFIPVKGMEQLKVKSAFLPYIEKIRVSPYREAAGKYFYDAAFDLKQFGDMTGRVKVEYEDQPADGKPRRTEQTTDMDATPGTTVMTIAVPVTEFALRSGELRLYDAATGELWQSELLVDTDMTALNALFSAYLDRSYYTDELHARVICAIGLPETSLREMQLTVLAPPEETAPPTAVLQQIMELKIPLRRIPEGATPLTVRLRRADDTVVFEQTLELVKRPPNPGCEWKIDHENRVVLRNGEPFFLHGVNLSIYSAFDPDAAMRSIRELGFNAVLYSNPYTRWGGSGLDPTNTAYLDLARKHNLLVMPWMESYGGKPPEDAPYLDSSGGQSLVGLHFALVRNKRFEEMSFAERTAFWEDAVARQMPRFLTAAATVKNHPNFLGYFIFDEPVEKIKYDQISSGQEFYRKLHETDGYHPIMINYCHLPKGEEYVDWCDVLAVDPYWVPPGRPNRVSRFTAQAWRRAAPRRNPVWSVPCGELWSFIHKRVIGPHENLCQTYLALIHGAKGLWYFTYPFKYKFTADGFKTINCHLETLGSIVLTPPINQTINDGRDNFNDIQAALFRHPDGGYVLLAANRCEYPVDAAFTLSNLGETEKVGQIFDENWSAITQNTSFQDKFEPFGVRAYTLNGSGVRHQESNTVNITIAMTPRPDAVPPEPLIPATGRPGKRNLMQNPGFELITLPGVPDYYPMTGNLGTEYYYGQPDSYFGQPGALARLDEKNPFEGKYSLRLKVDPSRGAAHNFVRFQLAPQSDTPLPFVLSVYMRADREGVKARFSRKGASFGDDEPLILTTEWQRYYKVGMIGPGNAEAWQNVFSITIRPPEPGTSCTVWMDAIQVEPGTEPTEYEP